MGMFSDLLPEGKKPGMFSDLLPEADDTWSAEASHALARGSFRAAAAVPGTAASALEMSPILKIGQLLPRWTPLGAITRLTEEPRQAAKRQLRKVAADVYGAASAPSLQPKKGGVGGYILNTMLETAPVLAASTAATIATGPVGGFVVGGMTMGEDAYQGAVAKGASQGTAEAERLINFMIGGAIERLQADEVLKLGKGSIKAVIQAARDRAWKKLGKEAGKVTAEVLAGAASEALEETLQEATQIGSAVLHGEKVFTAANARRLLAAGVGGATMGGLMKGGRTAIGTVAEPRPADAPAYRDETVAAPITVDELGAKVRGAEPELPTAETVPAPVPEPPGGWPMTAEQAAAAMTGMQEANTPATPESDDPYRMSARQADIAAGRERRGLESITPQDSISWAESSRLAQEQGIKDKAVDLATVVNAEPRALTHVETAGMVDRAIELDNQYQQLTAQLAEVGSNAEAVKVVTAAIDRNQAEYNTLTRAIDTSGSEKGRDLAAQKLTKGRDFRLVSVIAKATAAKGAPLDGLERAQLTEDVKKLEEATAVVEPLEQKAAEDAAAGNLGLTPEVQEIVKQEREATGKADVIRKELTRRRANRVIRSKRGLRRYIGMSEADKDAELQQLLAEVGDEPTARDLLDIAMNIASRPGVNNVGDVAARMQGYFPGLGQDALAQAIATATQRGLRTHSPLIQKLYDIRQEGRTNAQLQLGTQDFIYYLENGEVPERMVRLTKNPTEAIAALREIKEFYRRKLETSEPALKQKFEEQIAIYEARIASGDFAPRAKPTPIPMSEELQQLEARRDKLRADLAAMRKPGLRRYTLMSEADKNTELQTLLGRDMDARNITAIADNLSSRDGVGSFEDVARQMAELIPGLERATIVDAINTDTQRKARVTDGTVARLQEIARRQPEQNKRLRTAITDILYYLNSGQVPERVQREGKSETWDVNQQLAEVRDMLKKELRNSEPMEQQRLNEQIVYLNTRIANEDYAPRTRTKRPQYDRATWRKRNEISRLKGVIEDRYARLRPRTGWERVWDSVKGIAYFQQSTVGSMDDSAFANQGAWQLFTHPLRTLRKLPKTFAAIKSDEDAMRIEEAGANRPNAHLYERDLRGILVPVVGDQTFTHGEEIVRSRLATRLPGLGRLIRASNRVYAVTLNEIRRDAYDALVAPYAAEGGPPPLEGRILGDLVGVTTGRGRFGQKIEQVVEAANGIAWAPRKRLSDLMLAVGQPLLRKQPWRVRKAVMREYAQHALGCYVAGQLISLVWGPPEKDKRSSYYGKWHIPGTNTYVSPFQGLARVTALLYQIYTGEKKTRSGEIVSVRGPDVPYGGDDAWDLMTRWARTGLAPGPRAVVDWITGENVIGEQVTTIGVLAESVTPMSLKTMYEVMTEEMGVPTAMAVNVVAFFGMSVHVEEQRETGGGDDRRRQLRRRRTR